MVSAAAREIAGSFDRLRVLVKPGDKIYVKRAAASARFKLTPLVGRHRHGAALSVAF